MRSLVRFMQLAALVAVNAVCDAVPKPTLRHALTARVTLGDLIGPIPVNGQSGDIIAVEPITGGYLRGIIDGTVSGGAATVTITSNETVATPFVEIYGETHDKVPFFVTARGIGIPGAQLARIEIDIGGRYANLSNEFVLATFTDNDKNPPTVSNIEAWIVSRELPGQ